MPEPEADLEALALPLVVALGAALRVEEALDLAERVLVEVKVMSTGTPRACLGTACCWEAAAGPSSASSASA